MTKISLNLAKLKPVFKNDFKTEIKSGLNEGEKVIVSQVANGEQVGSMPRGSKNVLKVR